LHAEEGRGNETNKGRPSTNISRLKTSAKLIIGRFKALADKRRRYL